MGLYDLFRLIVPVFEVVMYFLLFEAFLKRRSHYDFKYCLIGIVCFSLIAGLCNFLFLGSVVNIFLIAVFAVVFAVIFYEGSIIKKLMSVALCLGISCAMEGLTVSFFAFLFSTDTETVVMDPAYYISGAIASKGLGLAICNVIRLKSNAQNVELGRAYWVLFFLLFASDNLAVFLLFRFSYLMSLTRYNGLIVICSLGLFFAMFFTLYLYEHITRQSEKLRFQEQNEQQFRLQMKHMDDLLTKQAELRSFKHDISNQFIAIYGYLEAGDLPGSKQYIKERFHDLDVLSPSVSTGNTTLDAILSTKKALAERHGIIFRMRVMVPEQIVLAPVDQCIIFGNALDNAIEACERCGKDSDRFIEFSLIQKKNKLICEIVNSAPPDQGNSLNTTKMDKGNHGFGLRNVRAALAKYDSEPIIEQKDGQFVLRFLVFV